MKKFILSLPVALTLVGVFLMSCVTQEPHIASGSYGSTMSVKRGALPQNTAMWLKNSSQVTWLPRQVSGRVDGATALDNIRQAAAGQAVKRSSYGTAPGGYVKLDPRMLRAMKILVQEGYRIRVTSMAGASHSRTSRHYAGLAFDVDFINGVKVGYSNPYWRKFLARCRELGATETLGPGDKGHSSHVHAAWPRVVPLR